MKTFVLYHANCADGFGAATAAWMKMGDQAEYIPVADRKVMPMAVHPGDTIYILDFSFPRAVMEDLAANVRGPDGTGAVIVIDHHLTALHDLHTFPGAVFDLNKSGAVLAWECFNPDCAVPVFLQYIQDRDLWQWKLHKSREVSAAIATLPRDFKVWSRFMDNFSLADLKDNGSAILRYIEQQVERATKSCMWAHFMPGGEFVSLIHQDKTNARLDGYLVPCVNATACISEINERLLEKFTTCSFSATYADGCNGERNWSLRSRPTFDCSVIAKANGGGGHAQASGFKQTF